MQVFKPFVLSYIQGRGLYKSTLPGFAQGYAMAGDKLRVHEFITLILAFRIEVRMGIAKYYVIIPCSYFTFLALYIIFAEVRLYEET